MLSFMDRQEQSDDNRQVSMRYVREEKRCCRTSDADLSRVHYLQRREEPLRGSTSASLSFGLRDSGYHQRPRHHQKNNLLVTSVVLKSSSCVLDAAGRPTAIAKKAAPMSGTTRPVQLPSAEVAVPRRLRLQYRADDVVSLWCTR